MKRAKFENHSVCCDKCDVWYHLVCLGLKGTEPEFVEGSTLPSFCPSCAATHQSSNDNPPESVNECEPSTSNNNEHVPKSRKGKGHGIKSMRNTQSYSSTIVQTHQSQQSVNDS